MENICWCFEIKKKKLHLQDKAVEFRKYLFSFHSNNHVMRDFVMSKIKSFQNLIFLLF